MSGQVPEHAVGDDIDGYVLGERISERVGAVTHEATGPDSTRVHITLYSPECFPSALVRERSLRELRQLMTVSVGCIVRVVGAGKLETGGIYEVTEPVDGPTLSQHPSPRTADTLWPIVTRIGDALLEGQRLGVIHRNLGPHVIYDTSEGVKIGSFAVGEPLGARSYGPPTTIAPEQVAGKVVDQRSLIYNLAALIVELRSGRPLFDGSREQVLEQHLESEPPPGLEDELARALAKDPRKRPMMLKQFLADVVGAVPNDSAPADESSAPSPGAGASPTTRGWTQFMEANESSGSSESQAGMTPTLAGTEAVHKPTTRGWTMFMEEEETEGGGEVAAAPASSAPVHSEVAPTTRGWTQFMEGEEGPEDVPASGRKGGPDAPTRPEPRAESAGKAAPAGDAVKPSTRGWTQFMEDEESEAPPAVAAAPAAPVAPVAPAAVEPPSMSAAPAEPTPSTTPSPSPSASPVPSLGAPATHQAEAPVRQPKLPAKPGLPAALSGNAPQWTEKPGFAARLGASAAAPVTGAGAGPRNEGAPGSAALPNGAAPTGRSEWTAYEEPLPVGARESTEKAQPSIDPEAPVKSSRGWTAFMEAELPETGKSSADAPPAGANNGRLTNHSGPEVSDDGAGESVSQSGTETDAAAPQAHREPSASRFVEPAAAPENSYPAVESGDDRSLMAAEDESANPEGSQQQAGTEEPSAAEPVQAVAAQPTETDQRSVAKAPPTTKPAATTRSSQGRMIALAAGLAVIAIGTAVAAMLM